MSGDSVEDALAEALARLDEHGHVEEAWLRKSHPTHHEEVLRLLSMDARLAGGIAPGTRIGPFRIGRCLGHGGMGRVFEALAEDDAPPIAQGQRVALKFLHPELAADGRARARFAREAEASARVEHARVIKALALMDLTQGDRPHQVLVLQHCDGVSLRDVLASGPSLDANELTSVTAQLCDALDAVHTAGLVHRDVKPSNLMRDADGNVFLLDLGLAWLQDEHNRLTRTGQFVGSIDYAAPEQFAPGRIEPTVAMDLFALGATLYELATGTPPFDNYAAARASGAAPLLAPAPLARSRRADSIEAVIDDLLRMRAANRPSSARGVFERTQSLPRRDSGPLRQPRLGPDWATLYEAYMLLGEGRGRTLLITGRADLLHAWEADAHHRLTGASVPASTHVAGDGGASPPPTMHGVESDARHTWAVTLRAWAQTGRDYARVVFVPQPLVADERWSRTLAAWIQEAPDAGFLLILLSAPEPPSWLLDIKHAGALIVPWDLGGTPPAPAVDPSVLRELSDDDRVLLAAASRQGRTFRLEALAEVLGVPVDSIVLRLRRLDRTRGLLDWRGSECAFRDQATREALIGSSTDEPRVEG